MKVKGFYLNEQGSKQLKIIPEDFPTVNMTDILTSAALGLVTKGVVETCTCPKQSMPPPVPMQILFLPMEENRKNLESCILDDYKESLFNTCEHQQLPLMEGPPISIRVAQNTTPTTIYSPYIGRRKSRPTQQGHHPQGHQTHPSGGT
jgi:hypothetical protein